MEAPWIGLRVRVPPAWIDVNGHMNSTRYTLVVYDAHVAMTQAIGLGDDYVAATRCSKAVLESHMIYAREAALGDDLEVRSWLLAVDHKRLHFFHEVFNLTRGERAATSEQVDVHLDLGLRRSVPFPPALFASLQGWVRAHAALPRPVGVGSTIRPPRNTWLEPQA